MNATEKVVDKIRKLLAKARGTDNEAEAAVFAAKAHELMVAHDVQAEDVRDQTREDAPVVGEMGFPWKYDTQWSRLLAANVAKYCMCGFYRAWFRGSAGVKNYVFVGRQHRADIAKSTLEYLHATIIRMSNAAVSSEASRRAWREGAGLRMAERLRALRGGVTDSRELALYDAAQAEIAAVMEGLKMGKLKGVNQTVDFMRGYVAAESINLCEQVTAEKRRAADELAARGTLAIAAQ